jgi:hypothetical protein
MSFVYRYIYLLDQGIAAPYVGLPCTPDSINNVNTFVPTTPPVPIYLPNAGDVVDLPILN